MIPQKRELPPVQEDEELDDALDTADDDGGVLGIDFVFSLVIN
jgi:hypothetical protein